MFSGIPAASRPGSVVASQFRCPQQHGSRRSSRHSFRSFALATTPQCLHSPSYREAAMLAPLPLGLAPTPIDTDARLGDSRSAPWERFRPTRSNFLALDSLPFLDLLLVATLHLSAHFTTSCSFLFYPVLCNIPAPRGYTSHSIARRRGVKYPGPYRTFDVIL